MDIFADADCSGNATPGADEELRLARPDGDDLCIGAMASVVGTE